MHTMVMTTIVFNTKGPTIFPWELCQLLTGWTCCLQLGLRAVKMGLSLKYRRRYVQRAIKGQVEEFCATKVEQVERHIAKVMVEVSAN